jgi:hypothetical protein
MGLISVRRIRMVYLNNLFFSFFYRTVLLWGAPSRHLLNLKCVVILIHLFSLIFYLNSSHFYSVIRISFEWRCALGTVFILKYITGNAIWPRKIFFVDCFRIKYHHEIGSRSRFNDAEIPKKWLTVLNSLCCFDEYFLFKVFISCFAYKWVIRDRC